ncbi:cytochrome P450 [Streptomyces sp. NPDC127190]|uniref:cytochrome P450 n=1 Tax=unclassified Streptomyces TaxID=2593676 RepID=UPI003632DE32
MSRYDDVEFLLRDRRLGKDLSKTAYFAQLAGGPDEEPPPFLGLGMDGWDGNLFKLLDPPDHTTLRTLVAAPFTPAAVEALITSVTAITDELLADLPSHFDAMEVLGALLPVRVLGDMMGIPREDQKQFVDWSTEIARLLELGAAPPDDLAAASQRAVAECTEYFVKALEARRAEGGTDLMSTLLSVADTIEGLTVHHVAAMCVLLIVPGLDTFANLIGNAVVLLAQHPEVLNRLAEEPALGDDVLDEVLRLEPPTHASWRVVNEPIELHGQTMQTGDVVLLMLAAANRDEREFENPDAVSLGAHGRKHLSFGRGIHYCLGDNLSRLMAKEALIGLARRCGTLELEGDEVDLKPGLWLRGPARLPVKVTAREASA